MKAVAKHYMMGLVCVLLTACSKDKPPAETADDTTSPPPGPVGGTIVEIAPRSESSLSGTARFEPAEGGLRVVVQVKDAPPGEHGVHIHEVGNCTAPDGSSAGDHYNPEGHEHGKPPNQRHLGDFGNMIVADDGTGTLEIFVEGANLRSADPNSFLGRSIIVHANPDDGSQPSGNAGSRIGCGVIQI